MAHVHLDGSRVELKELVVTVIKAEHSAHMDKQARTNTYIKINIKVSKEQQ